MGVRQTRRGVVFFVLYGLLLAYALVWAQFDYVRDRAGSNLPYLYVVWAFAVVVLLVRSYLVLLRGITGAWEYLWLAIDLFVITWAVKLTGGISSEAGLLYAWPLVTCSVQRQGRRVFVVGLISVGLYVLATWPAEPNAKYVGMLTTRAFVLLLATVLSSGYAFTETARVEEITRLREQVALADYRTRLSREMHDGIQHYLVRIATRLDLAKVMLAQDPTQAAGMAIDQRLTVRQAADELRYLVRRLRSPVIERRGFIDALKDHLSMFEERSSIAADLEIEGAAASLPADTEHAAFRVVQEALTNAEKYADATGVKVHVVFAPGHLVCEVTDNGRGFDPAGVSDTPGPTGGFGLVSMRDRAASVGGTVGVTSAPGQGTRVTVTIPAASSGA